MFNFIQKLAGYKGPTAADYNKLVDRVNQLSKVTGSGGVSVITGTMGTNIIGDAAASSTGIKIVRVGGDGAYGGGAGVGGDGVYTCIEQTLDATDWTDEAGADKFDDKNATSIYALNLFENDCEATYKEALAYNDLMAVWTQKDDDGTARLVGVPVSGGGQVRLARTRAAAGAAQTIACNLVNNSGSELTGAELGSNITVYCRVCGGGNLNAAIPRLADEDYIFVTNINGAWWCTTVFQTSEDCDCYEE